MARASTAPPLRVVFLGTAPLACPSLEALRKDARYEIVGVITQPDRPRGRRLKLRPPPVKEVALGCGLAVHQPEKVRSPESLELLRRLAPDLIVVAAYGQLLPPALLNLPRHGCVNVHASILPRHRGAAPIQWAILEDDPETGVTIMQVDAGLDTGDMLTVASTPITPDDTAGSLHDRLADLGARLLVDTIPGFVSGRIQPRPQPEEGATYARKITREDGRIDWHRGAREIWNQVRALTPWPGAFTALARPNHPLTVKIRAARVVDGVTGAAGVQLASAKNTLLVGCGKNALEIHSLQPSGGRPMTAREFLAGHPLEPGAVWGGPPAVADGNRPAPELRPDGS